MPPIRTVIEPLTIESGGPTQVAMSPTLAAGTPPIKTVGQPGGRIGPPTCGTGGVPGVTIGHICISPTLAAGGIKQPLMCSVYNFYVTLNTEIPGSAAFVKSVDFSFRLFFHFLQDGITALYHAGLNKPVSLLLYRISSQLSLRLSQKVP